MGVILSFVLMVYGSGLEETASTAKGDSDEVYERAITSVRLQNLGDKRTRLNRSNFEDFSTDCFIGSPGKVKGKFLKFRISSPISETRLENHYNIDCYGTVSPENSFSTQIILQNKTNEIPATIYIYEPT